MTEIALTTPPVARKDHKETTLHGVTLTDDYAWLRDKDSPEVTEYLKAENAYAEALTADLAGLRDDLYNEMLSHIKQTDESAPYREGDWWYQVRTEEGKQYSIFCRKRASGTTPDTPEKIILDPPCAPPKPGAPSKTATSSLSWVGNENPQPAPGTAEHILLDGNQLAEGHAFFAIGASDISDDGRWLAYTTDPPASASTPSTSRISKPAKPSPVTVERVGSVVWAADNRTLFYTVEDEEQKRQFQLFRHTLGTPHSRRRPRLPGRRRALQPRRRPHPRRQIHRPRIRQPHHQRVPVPPRRSARRRIPRHQPAPGRTRVLRRPSQRPVLHPHQRSRPQLPSRHRARRCPRPRTLDRAHSPSRRRHARRRRPLRQLLRRLRTRRRPAPPAPLEVPGRSSRSHPLRRNRFSRARLHRLARTSTASSRPQAFRYGYQSLVTPGSVYEYDLAAARIHRSSSSRRSPAASTAPSMPASASTPLPPTASRSPSPSSIAATNSRGRNLKTRLRRSGCPSRPVIAQESPLRLRLRLLRLLAPARLQLQPPQPARSRRRHGLRAHPRRRRSRQPLARRRQDAASSATPSPTSSPPSSTSPPQRYGDPARVAIEGGSAGGLLMGAVTNMRTRPLPRRPLPRPLRRRHEHHARRHRSRSPSPSTKSGATPTSPKPSATCSVTRPTTTCEPAQLIPAILVKTCSTTARSCTGSLQSTSPNSAPSKPTTIPLLLVTNMDAGHGGACGRYDYLKEIAFDYAFLLRELGVM